MRRPELDMEIFRIRRDKLRSYIGDGVAIVPANLERVRNHDVNYPFRQSSNFWYLTGFDEPDAIFVFAPGREVESVLYVREKNPDAETWDGFRYGPEGVTQHFGIGMAHNLSDFDETIVGYIREADRVFYQHGVNRSLDHKLVPLLDRVAKSHGRTGQGRLPVFDLSQLVGELRLFKSDFELKQMKLAADITVEAHANMMKYVRPGVNERQVEAIYHMTTMLAGAPTYAYPAIVASGDRATTLHYRFNDQECRDGEILLIDAGCEVNGYAADITRSFPVNGKFSAAQQRVYQAVLDTQKELIEMIKPGVEYKAVREHSVDRLVDAILDLGLLSGRKEDIVENGEYRKYYPHGVGHWLGLDVHDSGLYEKGGESRVFEPGMTLTIEPGLYIPLSDTSVPEEYRGIGVRIEDNIYVTAQGCDNLTREIPKEIEELEELVGSGLTVPQIRSSLY